MNIFSILTSSMSSSATRVIALLSARVPATVSHSSSLAFNIALNRLVTGKKFITIRSFINSI